VKHFLYLLDHEEKLLQQKYNSKCPSEYLALQNIRFQDYFHTFLFASLSVVPLLSLDAEANNIFAVLIENKTTEARPTENAATCAFDVFGILM